MVQSMTAFSRAQAQTSNTVLCWEIRSVNHRYLDISFRLPESMRALEMPLRTQLRDKIARGKIECQLRVQEASGEKIHVNVNAELVSNLLEIGHELVTTHQLANDLAVSHILQWPGVIQTKVINQELMAEEAASLFNVAIKQLVEMRGQEGRALSNILSSKIEELAHQVREARSHIKEQLNGTKDKLLTRLHAIKLEVPEVRLEHELALILARMDVSEELDRLSTHIEEVKRSLNGQVAAGRRLDFLMQELNREANTLSSKSDSVALTQCALEMKVIIEQMREQIQNIE